MNGLDRREEIINILKNASQAISGTNLANELNVSRQLIVGDIALLRAAGMDIISTPKGYILNNKESDENYIIRTIACRHSKDFIKDELNSIVDEGATVVNVIVEHSVYGQITADLHLSSRRDVKEFMKKLKVEDVNPLAQLTDGIHLHTIKCRDEETFEEVIKSLKEKGYLY
ncbi:transcription repressor NadR [Romboutsia sp.]|uniref:transcription repressor NadR n=1 Tax=Romboutsia sp. TaxID=1965302 RepID=UPI002C0BED0E|nr:transcription repressor NadR [Romboutsia sp.]HSQ90401.1 transcription repressor NadR [Romboutsia sp.]